MAIFKLGAFVTEIVGSIGGTNFKRGKNNFVVTNKSMGYSKSKLYQNPWLNQIGNIFKAWALLTPGERNDWDYNATLYQFPDKFGVMRNLTGRQLYSKLAIQLLPVGASLPEADQINNTISSVAIDNFDLTIAPFQAELQLQVTGDDNYILVQIEIAQKNLLAPIFSKRKITAFMFGSGAIGFDITAQILEQFPFINPNYRVRAFVTCMNESGFKGTSIYRDGSWTA
jgi:hypothetical protein